MIIMLSNKSLNVFFDPCHLIKGIRNNFITKDIMFENMKCTWQDIIHVYNTDCAHTNSRLLYKITDEHAIPDRIKKMKRDSCNGIDSNINSSTSNSCMIDQEPSTSFGAIDLVNCDEACRPVILLEDDFNMIDCKQNVGNTYELLYELPAEISNEETLSDINNTLKTLTDLDQNNSTDLNVSLHNRNPDLLSHNDTTSVELTVDNSITNQNHQMELIKEVSTTNVCETNNRCSPSNEIISSVPVEKDDSQKRPFKEIFTLPVEYLPKKKRNKIEKTGKSKLPSVGTSDEWYSLHLEKENLKKQKEEKQRNKKKLQEEKKKLMEQIQEIQKRIKQEK